MRFNDTTSPFVDNSKMESDFLKNKNNSQNLVAPPLVSNEQLECNRNQYNIVGNKYKHQKYWKHELATPPYHRINSSISLGVDYTKSQPLST